MRGLNICLVAGTGESGVLPNREMVPDQGASLDGAYEQKTVTAPVFGDAGSAGLQNKPSMQPSVGFSGDATLAHNAGSRQAGASGQVGCSLAGQCPGTCADNSLSREKNSAPELKPYHLPDLAIFIGVASERQDKQVRDELEVRAHLLEEKLERFGVQGKVTALKYGPVVTLFEYQPEIDTKLSKILALEDDLALALEAVSIRILAPIPGRSVVGFEVANQRRLDVAFAPIVRSKYYREYAGVLPLVLGQDTIGNQVIVELSKMPHLLIAGSTGSGKSVALNVMLMSLLCRLSPDDLKLILIDPKRLEFASYADIAHLLFPVITDALQATMALRWVVGEMESRYQKMACVWGAYHCRLSSQTAGEAIALYCCGD